MTLSPSSRRLLAPVLALALILGLSWARPAAAAADTKAPSPADRAAIEEVVRTYLHDHPEILVDAIQSLQERQQADEDAHARLAIKAHAKQLFEDPEIPVGGNPKGDVTLVEFLDYRCPYCKKAHQTVQDVLAKDGKIRYVVKELPILGDASVMTSRIALASRAQGKYVAFSGALMEAKGDFTEARVYDIAATVGLDVPALKKAVTDQKAAIETTIRGNLALAEALGVHGTPAFLVGDTLIPGATDADSLIKLVADTRQAAKK